MDEEAIFEARRGSSADSKEDAILKFASQIVETRGIVSDEQVANLKGQGVSDGEIAEVVGNVALNIFTNYFNHVAGTEIDFPVAAKLTAEQTCHSGA